MHEILEDFGMPPVPEAWAVERERCPTALDYYIEVRKVQLEEEKKLKMDPEYWKEHFRRKEEVLVEGYTIETPPNWPGQSEERVQETVHRAAEALAAGRVVVGSSVGGIPSLVQSGLSGLLVAPEDVEGFATALQEVDPEWGKNGPELVSHLGVEPHGRFVRQMYDDLTI